MSIDNALPFPYAIARSTGTESQALLTALLAAECFDEISNADDYDAVRGYIAGSGHAEDGKIARGLTFWVYPTGLSGPYHDTEDGEVEKHGLLVTIQRGASVSEAVERVKEVFVPPSGLAHTHIPA